PAADRALVIIAAGVSPHSQVADAGKGSARLEVAPRQGGREDLLADEPDIVSDERRSHIRNRPQQADMIDRGRDVRIGTKVEKISKPLSTDAELVDQAVLVIVVVPPEAGSKDPLIGRIEPPEAGPQVAPPGSLVVRHEPAGAHPEDKFVGI